MENEINNDINNEIKLEKNNLLNTVLGKTINSAIDIGLKALLPDLIENQVIDIKNALFENGLKSGIETAINSVEFLGKSAIGIFTGNFENMSQVKTAVGEGGIIDTVSNVLDKTVNTVRNKGYIDNSIAKIIKSGKNILLENVEKNIKNEMEFQDSLEKQLNSCIKEWNKCYENKDFEGMTKQYNKIMLREKEIIPLENIINKTREIKNIHNLIKNNGQNFNITNEELELAKKFQK